MSCQDKHFNQCKSDSKEQCRKCEKLLCSEHYVKKHSLCRVCYWNKDIEKKCKFCSYSTTVGLYQFEAVHNLNGYKCYECDSYVCCVCADDKNLFYSRKSGKCLDCWILKSSYIDYLTTKDFSKISQSLIKFSLAALFK